ncbi:TPA: hypothetical protein ACRNL1_000904 [Pseudomonas aeruginosa]|uniref:hypothetical protein n=2 Tax=Pseudomonas aeruginosa TaxID=287 RepID=UPI0003B9B270|nr:hypothetical protein [Pseudomonas aeruginosa]ERY33005.1 hypothetical protein Q066_05450 [Pseudomonas aeruginosa BL12]MCS7668060.1 hypothetical protein [Pseudomonas aeruginosa]MCS8109576.1 hypothetical protein [Pseudomonas aeruginosa]MCS8762516.1 hypothetical protein [Pseudomonas aeruginosa]MCS8929561.1 hypothetical protein [Pseudomonas aeruginosa]
MTTPISDEQLAELEGYSQHPAFLGDEDSAITMGELRGLIARLRAAEADAKRYRWLRDSGRLLGDSMDSHADYFFVVTADGEDVMWFEQLDSAIDAAMERTP